MQADLSAEQYRQAIERIQHYIQAGDCYQVNFAQRFRAPVPGRSMGGVLRVARGVPDAVFRLPEPARRRRGAEPVAGALRQSQRAPGRNPPDQRHPPTRPDAAEDAANAAELLASPKDRAENLMIVDLLRNDLGRTCRIGSVRVPELFSLESYPNVHHLVSSVTGELADDRDALDLIAGSFPGGSITGAPKIRAMQIIDELEPTRRGLYCGSLLYLDVRGEMDSSIAIRSLLVKDGQVCCWGGGGIVADSRVAGRVSGIDHQGEGAARYPAKPLKTSPAEPAPTRIATIL